MDDSLIYPSLALLFVFVDIDLTLYIYCYLYVCSKCFSHRLDLNSLSDPIERYEEENGEAKRRLESCHPCKWTCVRMQGA